MRRTADKIIKRWEKFALVPSFYRWHFHKGDKARLVRSATKVVQRMEKLLLWAAFSSFSHYYRSGQETQANSAGRVKLGASSSRPSSVPKLSLPLPASEAEDSSTLRARAVGIASALVEEITQINRVFEAEISLDSRQEGLSFEYEDWVPRLCGMR